MPDNDITIKINSDTGEAAAALKSFFADINQRLENLSKFGVPPNDSSGRVPVAAQGAPNPTGASGPAGPDNLVSRSGDASFNDQVHGATDSLTKAATTPWEKKLEEFQKRWGDVSQSLTNGAFKLVQQGVNGISKALTEVITGSKGAGQAFAQLGEQMLSGLIETVLQAMLMAYIAIPVLTALGVLTGGATAATGSGVVLAAMGSALGGVSGMIGHAGGGLIRGPGTTTSDSIPAFLSHGEFVMPAASVSQYGVGFMESIRQGALGAQGLYAGAAGALTRPNYGAFGAGGGGVNVSGHQMSVAFINSKSEARDYLSSSAGEKHIIDIARRNRLSIGIGT